MLYSSIDELKSDIDVQFEQLVFDTLKEFGINYLSEYDNIHVNIIDDLYGVSFQKDVYLYDEFLFSVVCESEVDHIGNSYILKTNFKVLL